MAFRQICLISIAVVAAVVPIPDTWIERVYSTTLFPLVQPYVTSASNLSPIALLDIGVAVLLGLLLRGMAHDWRAAPGRQGLLLIGGRLASAAAVVYLLFLASWGLNYRRVPLEEKLAFDRGRVSLQAAESFAGLAIARLNAEYTAAHAQPLRRDALESAFAAAQALLRDPMKATTGRPKRSLAGLYFRYAAIDGMTVPIFLEVILNPDLLPIERPSVLAHEWAHLAGYADESEASFVAWITGVRSADPVARYSAWLDAYGLSVNALPPTARTRLPLLEDGPRQDLREIALRYRRSSPRIRAAARGVYDGYLKANRIEEGIANYAVVLQLLLGTTFDQDWQPAMRRQP